MLHKIGHSGGKPPRMTQSSPVDSTGFPGTLTWRVVSSAPTFSASPSALHPSSPILFHDCNSSPILFNDCTAHVSRPDSSQQQNTRKTKTNKNNKNTLTRTSSFTLVLTFSASIDRLVFIDVSAYLVQLIVWCSVKGVGYGACGVMRGE